MIKTLTGDAIFLRALELRDLDALYELENDEKVWEVSHTSTPYSKFVLKQYLENSHRDIYDVKQLRLVICISETKQSIGFIDLFDFDPKHQRVGVGIVIFLEKNRNKGYAKQSLELVTTYAKTHLNVHQLYAHITEDNNVSIQLFESLGFEKSGIKRDWIFSQGTFKNELLYQRIIENDGTSISHPS